MPENIIDTSYDQTTNGAHDTERPKGDEPESRPDIGEQFERAASQLNAAIDAAEKELARLKGIRDRGAPSKHPGTTTGVTVNMAPGFGGPVTEEMQSAMASAIREAVAKATRAPFDGPSNLSRLGKARLAETGAVSARAVAEKAPRKRVRKPAKAKAAAASSKPKHGPKAKGDKPARKGKSLPGPGTLGDKVLKAMALDGYTGQAPFITKTLGVKPAVVQGQLNNLLARGLVTSKGARAKRVWNLA